MAADGNEDNFNKTEEPTAHKLEELRKKNMVPVSRELVLALEILAFCFIFLFFGQKMFQDLGKAIKDFLKVSFNLNPLSYGDISKTMGDVFTVIAMNTGLFFVAAIVIGILATVVQTQGFLWSYHGLTPDINKINPFTGFMKVFSRQKLMESLRNIVKFCLLLGIAVLLFRNHYWDLARLTAMPIYPALSLISSFVMNLLFAICGGFLAIGLFDLWYQRWEFLNQHRMSKEEVKQEIKDREGDPHIKGKMKSLMRAANNKKMMAAVPKATAIVVNPTHFAVAIEYNESLYAPRVIAKGVDFLAMRMKKKAQELGIPVVENKPLARMLYKTVKVNGFVPRDLYQAIADVLAYVYKIKGRFS
jgi:flagellar biosynthetic protein FlhB